MKDIRLYIDNNLDKQLGLRRRKKLKQLRLITFLLFLSYLLPLSLSLFWAGPNYL